MIRCGTSIGTNVAEAKSAQSKFISKLSISEKKSNETEFWLKLLQENNYIEDGDFNKLQKENNLKLRILKTVIKNKTKSAK